MMAWILALAAVAVCLLLVGLLLGRGAFDFWQRLGLSSTACGLIAAGVPRLLGRPPGWFDLLFLAGLLMFFGRTYGGLLGKNLDALDGAIDGRLRVPWLRPGFLRAWAARGLQGSPAEPKD